MNLVLFDDISYREALKPLSLTEPIAELRCGILTVREKWERRLSLSSTTLTEEYLGVKFPVTYSGDNLYVCSSLLPNKKIIEGIKKLNLEQGITIKNELVAVRTSHKLIYGFSFSDKIEELEWDEKCDILKELPDLYLCNGSQIEEDFSLITHNLVSEEITDSATVVYCPENIYIGKNVSIKAAILNAENGSIYIAENAVIQEGAILIGPVAIGPNAMVSYGAKIRANTTLGPYCRVGGEVNNAIFQSYSNKAHDGFLGNSYVGSWCNLGANTNNSNLKNNFKTVSLYSYPHKKLIDTKQIFCGTFIGDYTKVGISTMFNTGTVVGVSCNVFGAGFQEKFIPSFSWGGNTHYEDFRYQKAVEIINATMERREKQLSEIDLDILKYISENP